MKNIEKYQIYDFCDEHNHPLHLLETSHMLISQRKLSQVQAHEIDLANDSGLKQKTSFELMSRQVGGRENLGYTRLDQKNYLRSKRLRNMAYGEAGSLLQYFQQESIENPSFYHTVQLDIEEQITNIFWADARMIMDYEYFGDVVTLDTTYSNNNAYRPLAVFAGFNHFRGVVIFGAALLYDETSESFEWLFREFLKAHKNKKPQTLFTDQDHAMAKALPRVMPETYHGLCSWHLMQNGIKHLGNLMKNGSHFLKDFSFCMYKCSEEADFQIAWDKLLDEYNLHDNKWLIGVYKVKEKWAKCYMKNTSTIGMQSTQLSESFNADLKTCMKPDLDIIQFFKHFERVVSDKRYNELQCEFESRQKVPRLKMENSPLLQQVLDVKDIKKLPIQYILKRWTREAKNGFVKDTHGKHVQEDANLDSTQRYRKICPKLVRIATQASDCKEAYFFMEKAIEDLRKQVDEICKKNLGLENINVDLSSSFPNENHFLQVKGLKRRNGIKNWRKRPKSWVENQPKKTKKVPKISASQNKQLKENNDISSSHESDHGFNRLLMSVASSIRNPETGVIRFLLLLVSSSSSGKEVEDDDADHRT
ncbi:protein FAR1-RELATED SEQUENCE 5-like [Gastrolobium bilobum]|uniref:protein FAR1-RELATED SEQUENCE 5-like n=1 Tax=Gastrolobium bilobum TaxID=150636 RepID=UPI002AAF515D|nr:protein FAR1-RELATED SEQUENCE 5-like [Gastrolobium bilobum]